MKKLILSIVALAFLSFSASAQAGGQAIDNAARINYTQDSGGSGGGNVIISSETFSRAQIFCDDFNRGNSTNVTGWTEQSGDWQISNNMLQTPGVDVWEYITADGTAQTDGCITVRAKYNSQAQIKFVGAVARYTASNSNIMFKIQDNSSSGYWDSYFLRTNGIFGSIDLFLTGQDYGTDATIQMEYTGSNVTVRIDTNNDGTWDHTNSGTVGNTTAGLCGISGFNAAFADDFCCGNDCEIEPVPLTSIGLYFALGLIVLFVAFRAYRKA